LPCFGLEPVKSLNMKRLEELNVELIEVKKNYGIKYFIFIGPSSLVRAQELKLFDYYVFNQIQPPPELYNEIMELDIYLVEYDKIRGMQKGAPVSFSRWSTANKLNL
jgi:hypothetical protein